MQMKRYIVEELGHKGDQLRYEKGRGAVKQFRKDRVSAAILHQLSDGYSRYLESGGNIEVFECLNVC